MYFCTVTIFVLYIVDWNSKDTLDLFCAEYDTLEDENQMSSNNIYYAQNNKHGLMNTISDFSIM